MKTTEATTRTRRRRYRRVSGPPIATYYFFVAINCGHGVIGTFCRVPVGAESRRYHDGHSPPFRSHSIVDGVRCDEGDVDGVDIRTERLIAPSSLTVATPSPLASYGRRATSERPRERIILLRGGAHNVKSVDDELGPANNSESDGEDANTQASAASRNGRDGLNRPSDPDDDGIPHQIHRAFHSFLSWFRVPEGSGDRDNARAAADIACIAHKMPHGPDGRGGGSSAVVEAPPARRGVDVSDERARVKEFAITAEVAEVVANEDVADVGELGSGKLSSPEKPPAGARASTAFVVPPNHSALSSADTGKRYDVKERKSSKIKLAVGDVYEAHAMTVSLNSTRNETEMIRLSDATLNGNSTESIPVSDATTDVGQNSYDLELLSPKDYTSSGYVSFLTLIL